MFTRRQALLGVSSALLLPVARAGLPGNGDDSRGAFAHGVASGDPKHDSIVLWTRVSGFDGPVEGEWQVAADRGFREIAAAGKFRTGRQRDHTVKVIASGLDPGCSYHYRFAVGSRQSPTGVTRTLPDAGLSQLGIAVVSCSNYPFGYFNAYQAIAEDPEIDVVLHLGDYIYEYGPDGYGGVTGRELGRVHEPRHETLTLADYRMRHAQYKSDAGSQAMHGVHPLIAIWDDHESTNNPWTGGAENHQPETEGNWPERRAAALQAYYEWMPVRDPESADRRAHYWRHFRFGDLASLVTLETRHTGRSQQIEYGPHLDAIESASQAKAFAREALGQPDRNMLSPEMEAFLGDALRESVRAGRPWRLIGNQIPMARTHVPRLEGPFFDGLELDPDDPVDGHIATLKRLGELDLPIYLDTWDGYPAARERFYEVCRRSGANDLVVLTGDSHSFWENRLFAANGLPMGVEIGTTGVTSPGDFVALGPEGALLMDELLAAHNPEIRWTDCRHNGYVRLVLDRQRGRADYVWITNIASPSWSGEVIRSAEISRREGALEYVRN